MDAAQESGPALVADVTTESLQATLAAARQRAEEVRRRSEAVRRRADKVRLRAVDLRRRSEWLGASTGGERRPPAADRPPSERTGGPSGEGAGEPTQFRAAAARLALAMADQADQFASYLEERTGGPGGSDQERRVKMASIERRVAAVGRRNAARMRRLDFRADTLERLPRLWSEEAPPGDGGGGPPAP